MAITTLAQVVSGLQQQPVWIAKAGPVVFGSNLWGTYWASAGSPLVGSYSGLTLAGSVLSNPTTGGMPWTDPSSGNAYLARLQITAGVGISTTSPTSFILCDRLWHNGGIDVTNISTPQTVGSATWPARDLNGATSGVGVLLGLEISTTVGAGVPTISVSYTNSSGTSGQTATSVNTLTTGALVSTFFPLTLAAGDIGVQSVQSVSLATASWVSGAINLVAYRPIAMIDSSQSRSTALDAATGALPRIYNGSVLYLICNCRFGTSISTSGEAQFTWG